MKEKNCIKSPRGNQGLCVGVRSVSALKISGSKMIHSLTHPQLTCHPPSSSHRTLLARIRLHNTYLRYTSYNILYSFILLIISILLTDRDSFTARTRANDRLCRLWRTVFLSSFSRSVSPPDTLRSILYIYSF